MSRPQDLFNEALLLHQSGRIPEAIGLYNGLLTGNENNPQLLYMLGCANVQIGQLARGAEQMEKSIALNPNNALAHYNLGIVLTDLRRPGDALASYDRAIALQPDIPEAHYNRGNILMDLERLDEALAAYDRAVALNPNYAEAYDNRGIVLVALKRLDEALASYDRAVTLKPDYAEAYNNRGIALGSVRRLDEALDSYNRAIELNPDFTEAYSNRGNVLRYLNRLDEALASYDRAIALQPDHAVACNNRGLVLQDTRRLDEALAAYDQAIALKPDYAEAHWNKSLLLILTGQYLAGWELYEWRLQKEDSRNEHYVFPQPAWRGQEEITGKRLLVYYEQGLGDAVQFCRYLPKVQALGADIIFEVPPVLVSFISSLNCRMRVVAKGSPLPEFDAYCPIMSLPMVFKTTVDTIPAEAPYLFSDKIKVEQWLQELGTRTKPRIGLVWAGSSEHKNDANRSIPLELLLPLTELPVELHSLQKEYRQHDRATLDQHPEIRQHQDDLADFSDTAALIDCLDLVISVDTSVAHVAGAMGKPVWILLPFAPDYRWMLEREDSPWYPTAKLFRQPQLGDWQSVIKEVVNSFPAPREQR